MKLNVVRLDLIDYNEAFELQNKLLKARQEERIEDTLLILEHPPVITIGRSGSRSNILVSEEFLEKQGVSFYEINRGGDVTYHGPGQIVGYPIIDLQNHNRDIRLFVRNLEEVFIDLLSKEYGISASRHPVHTGVWIGDDKITAIGLAIKRRVTQHGFAFNVNTDLSHFDWIIPCGITDKGVVSLGKILGKPLDMEKVQDQVIHYFCSIYGYEKIEFDIKTLIKKIEGGNDEEA